MIADREQLTGVDDIDRSGHPMGCKVSTIEMAMWQGGLCGVVAFVDQCLMCHDKS